MSASALRPANPLMRFMVWPAAGGLLLLLCATAAIVWANSSWRESYGQLVHAQIGAGVLRKSVEWWINDALMAVFFFTIGLEIKREALFGELRNLRTAALPIIGAAGGMLVPALIYFAFNRTGTTVRGWGIPVATDIAFSLGVLSLLGSRVPRGLRVFLTTLAVADDIGALLVIALFYAGPLQWACLGGAAACLVVMFVLNRLGVLKWWAYLIPGLVMWWLTYQSGVHATIAGVAAALAIPARGEHSLLHQLERGLAPWVTFLILPLFALANSGVVLAGDFGAALSTPVTRGVMLGLTLGKPVGITLACLIAVGLRAGQLPTSVNWRMLHGCAWVAGIGFTMSLFIANLAFPAEGHGAALNEAKLGIMAGSSAAAVVGLVLLSLFSSAGSPALPRTGSPRPPS